MLSTSEKSSVHATLGSGSSPASTNRREVPVPVVRVGQRPTPPWRRVGRHGVVAGEASLERAFAAGQARDPVLDLVNPACLHQRDDRRPLAGAVLAEDPAAGAQ